MTGDFDFEGFLADLGLASSFTGLFGATASYLIGSGASYLISSLAGFLVDFLVVAFLEGLTYLGSGSSASCLISGAASTFSSSWSSISTSSYAGCFYFLPFDTDFLAVNFLAGGFLGDTLYGDTFSSSISSGSCSS